MTSSLSQLPCHLRYKRELAVIFLLLGGLIVGLGIWLLLLGQLHITLFLGCLIAFIGYNYLTRPIATIHIDQVVIYNLLGRVVKSHALAAFSDLQLHERRLYVHQGGSRKKVNLFPWIIHTKDWQKLEAILTVQPQLQAK